MTEEELENFNIPKSVLIKKCIQLEKQLTKKDKRIAELEAEVKEWKDKADLWCKTANLKDHNIMINKELEKENTELKEKYVKNITDCDICDTYCNSHLTKAKELLKQFMKFYERTARECYSKDFQKTLADTEQFLSEVEK